MSIVGEIGTRVVKIAEREHYRHACQLALATALDRVVDVDHRESILHDNNDDDNDANDDEGEDDLLVLECY